MAFPKTQITSATLYGVIQDACRTYNGETSTSEGCAPLSQCSASLFGRKGFLGKIRTGSLLNEIKENDPPDVILNKLKKFFKGSGYWEQYKSLKSILFQKLLDKFSLMPGNNYMFDNNGALSYLSSLENALNAPKPTLSSASAAASVSASTTSSKTPVWNFRSFLSDKPLQEESSFCAITLNEPSLCRYLHINHQTNKIHLMLPLVGGDEIGTDNTCQSLAAMKQFFGKSTTSNVSKNAAINELNRYAALIKEDLQYADILSPEDAKKKRDRLQQVERYITLLTDLQRRPEINALTAGMPNYPEAVRNLLGERSNIYAMHLRPAAIDGFLRTVAPVFSVHRPGYGQSDIPDSFSSKLNNQLASLNPVPRNLKLIIQTEVIKRLESKKADINVDIIRAELIAYMKEKLQPSQEQEENFPKFDKDSFGTDLTDKYLKEDMYCETYKDYLENLLSACATDLLNLIPQSPFNQITEQTNKETKSILIQFLIAQINILCHANDFTTENFGTILDRNSALSNNLINTIRIAIEAQSPDKTPVETAVIQFFNTHKEQFGLTRDINAEEAEVIKERFHQHYMTIHEAPHKDEFFILDKTKKGDFYSHQGAICFGLSNIMLTGFDALLSEKDRQYLLEIEMDRNVHLEPSLIHPEKQDAVNIRQCINIPDFIEHLSQILDIPNLTEAQLYPCIPWLLMQVGSKQKLFELLGPERLQELCRKPSGQSLKKLVSKNIQDSALLTKWSEYINETNIHINLENAYSLYVEAIACAKNDGMNRKRLEDNFDYLSPPCLLELLNDTLLLDVQAIEKNNGGGFTLTCTKSAAEKINEYIRNNQRLYLPRDMAASLYKEVTRNFGENSSQVRELNNLSNAGAPPPPKLTQALELLHIDINREQVTFPDGGVGTNGFIVTARPDQIALIQDIHYSHNLFTLDRETAGRLAQRLIDVGGWYSQNEYLLRIRDRATSKETAQAIREEENDIFWMLNYIGVFWKSVSKKTIAKSVIYEINMDKTENQLIRDFLNEEKPLKLTGTENFRSSWSPAFELDTKPVQQSVVQASRPFSREDMRKVNDFLQSLLTKIQNNNTVAEGKLTDFINTLGDSYQKYTPNSLDECRFRKNPPAIILKNIVIALGKGRLEFFRIKTSHGKTYWDSSDVNLEQVCPVVTQCFPGILKPLRPVQQPSSSSSSSSSGPSF